MKKADRKEILKKLDCIINLVQDKNLINEYPTVDLLELIDSDMKEIIASLPPERDIDPEIDNFETKH